MDAKHTLGEPRALVSRAAILHNIRLIRSHIAPGVKVCAMIKADAYGHGAQTLLDALSNFQSGDLEAPAFIGRCWRKRLRLRLRALTDLSFAF